MSYTFTFAEEDIDRSRIDPEIDSDITDCTVLVSGIRSTISSYFLELYFKQEGDIASMEVDQPAGQARIQFQDKKGMMLLW